MSWLIERTDDLAACLSLRKEVFIEEQNVPEADEVDGRDADAVHLLATLDGTPVGTARILIKGHTAKIGRICVVKSQRGFGLGAAIVRSALAYASTVQGLTRAELGAQEIAIGFYENLGFVAYGPIYMDAGIRHRDMERSL